MERVSLPREVKPGPTKPEVRAVVISKLSLGPSDHVVDVGAGSGAVTITAARRADRVTAIERDSRRVEAIRANLAANDHDAAVTVREAEAPAGVPTDADAAFVGGSRNYRAVLDRLVEAGVERIVMAIARVGTAGAAVTAFRERGLLHEAVRLQVARGRELAGGTTFEPESAVYVIVGRTDGADEETDGAKTPTRAERADGEGDA